MECLRCGLDRPPPAAAESSIAPVVTCLSAPASPEDWHGVQVTLGKMEIATRFFQIVMPQQYLNGVQVGTGFQHVRGEAVTEDVGIPLRLASGMASGVLAGLTRGF